MVISALSQSSARRGWPQTSVSVSSGRLSQPTGSHRDVGDVMAMQPFRHLETEPVFELTGNGGPLISMITPPVSHHGDHRG
jgi:hypothetical protein